MRFQTLLMLASLAFWAGTAIAYVPGKSPSGADRHWDSGSISVELTGPTTVDGHSVQEGVRQAMSSWNAITHARIRLTATITFDRGEPAIGNGMNEFGWVERSDSPYFIPGVPCTTATIYDTLSGVMEEADTTCNAMAYQWPGGLFGLTTQDNVADAETASLAAFGSWLGLDASLLYGTPMSPVNGSGLVLRSLSSDEFAFARYRYGDGTSSNGVISGVVRFPDGSPVSYAYVMAIGIGGYNVYGAVAESTGAYTIHEPVSGTYTVVVRPLTTDPYIESSVPYRANAIHNLDFSPEYYGGAAQVEVRDGAATPNIDITATRSGSQPDAGEPNDSAATATPLTLGYSKLATTHAPSDKDWYTFRTRANNCYVVATSFHGASIVPVAPGIAFWSRTRLSIYDGAARVGQNESRDEFQLDPGNWWTFCESGAGRRLDVEVEQREPAGGGGFFYSVSVQALLGGATQAPSIGTLYPSSGWANRERFVWIGGADFMPGTSVDVHLPNGVWAAATNVITEGCDAAYRCSGLKALFPAAIPGAADVKITNPNGRSVTKVSAFTYIANGYGPIVDRTPGAFGIRFGDGRAVCVADYDGDGDDDILKTRNASLPYQLFRNNGDATFSDVAASAGLRLAPALYGESCSFIDVDDDGDLDVYTTNLTSAVPGGSSNELYINRLADTGSAGFVLSTPPGLGGSAGRYQTDAAWADFDDDGRLDVVMVDDAFAASPPYRDAVHYLRQDGTGSFTDATSASGLGGYVAAIASVKAADFDNDGCEDLVFFTHAGAANRLYRGNCHGHFTDQTAASHVADGSPWCVGVAIADFNNDGKLDIACGTYNAGSSPVRPRLWINNGSASFTDRAYGAGLSAVARNMEVVLPLDEDNDGLIDLYIGSSENGWLDDRKDVLFRNAGGNPPVFQDITDAVSLYPTTQDGTGYCGVGVDEFYCDRDAVAGGVLDWYGDGAQDVFVTGNDPDALQRGADLLWRNQSNLVASGVSAPSNDWIDVALTGGNTRTSRVLSNRFGLGAKVTVIPRFNLSGGAVPTETQCLQNPLPAGVVGITRELIAGNQSQSSIDLHFGLGTAMAFDRKIVDCVVVVWPSGLARAYPGVTANTRVVLAEDTGRIRIISVVPNTGPNTRSDPTMITGLRFDRDVAAVPQVYFGAVPARAVTFVSDHQLTVLPPLWQSPGTVDVTVVNTDGARDTLLASYTFTASGPSIRFKDPVPSLITVGGVIVSDPNVVSTSGVERTGVIADGATQLVLEAEVAGRGSVRFVIDDDEDSTNAPPPVTSVGTVTGLGGGAPQTIVTVPVVMRTDGRFFGHALYAAPQDFIRSTADNALAMRAIRVRAVFIDAAHTEFAMPSRTLDLHRVPILLVHGMWGDPSSFRWPILDDPRFLTHRVDFAATSDATFAENAGMPPRAIAELRKRLNDLGIAGTRFFVFGHSMGAVLFKIYMSGAGAPYARADNFLAGDVYALLSVDAPFFGSPLAPFTQSIASLRAIGLPFVDSMASLGLAVDRGCMASLDPSGPDIARLPSASGVFHAVVGWGGREMRSAGVGLLDGVELVGLENLLRFFNFSFDNYLLRCGPGDDFVVCTDSQQGGLASGSVDNFHYIDRSARAIHFDSIARELGPSASVERLLNTPTTNTSVWGRVLPRAPAPTQAESGAVRNPDIDRPRASGSTASGVSLSLAKQGDSIVLSWVGAASRLRKSLVPKPAPGVCLSVSGGLYTDAHELTVPTNAYYEAAADSLCTPVNALSIASLSPSSGPTGGGYRVTILGSGFDAADTVSVGNFRADEVLVVNPTTLTFRMMPGDSGGTTITVQNGAGQTASTTFLHADPGDIPGSVRITAPANGSAVSAGTTLTVSAEGSDGFTVDQALVVSRVFSSREDRDPGVLFAADVTVPVDVIGPIAVELLAKDRSGNVKRSAPVTITVVAPGNVTLKRLDAEKVTMQYASPTRQVHVYGIYSDGVRRELTRAAGISYEIDTQDPRKPNYPYNGTGVAAVDRNGVVTAKSTGSTMCHVGYSGLAVDLVIEVAEMRPTVTLLKPGFVSWPYQGQGITYDLIRGKLSALRSTGGNFADPSIGMTCIKNDFANVTAADVTNPPVADGFFYLMRESKTRSYEELPFWATRSQVGQRTDEIGAAPGACP